MSAPCPVCKVPVEAELVRMTRPGDPEYRWQSALWRYWEPGGEDEQVMHVHRMASHPLQMALSAPTEAEEPPHPAGEYVPPPRPATLTEQATEQAILTSALRFLDVE